MTKPDLQLNQQIDEMRARLIENALNEQILLRALAEALGQVDQQLLSEVRQVTADHEARRSDILGELQVLASRLCVFPKPIAGDHLRPRDQVTSLHDMGRDGAEGAGHDGAEGAGRIVAGGAAHKDAGGTARDNPEVMVHGTARVTPLTPRQPKPRHAPGDWRQAASNIDDELDLYLDARAQSN